MFCTNKGVLIHEIDAIIREWGLSLMDLDIPSNNCAGTENQFVVVIDGIAVVNSLNKTSEIKTCKNCSNKFNDMIMRETVDCDEIRVIFDRYVSNSLKGATRGKRCDGDATKYKVTDTTNIEGISMKSFLSHVETKHYLIEYLANNLMTQFIQAKKHFVIVYHDISISNIRDQHEEADTLIILHVLDVALKDSYSDLCIFPPETDVLLMLIYYYPQLCLKTVFKRRKGKDIRKIDIGQAYQAITT